MSRMMAAGGLVVKIDTKSGGTAQLRLHIPRAPRRTSWNDVEPRRRTKRRNARWDIRRNSGPFQWTGGGRCQGHGRRYLHRDLDISSPYIAVNQRVSLSKLTAFRWSLVLAVAKSFCRHDGLWSRRTLNARRSRCALRRLKGAPTIRKGAVHIHVRLLRVDYAP